MEKGSIGQNSRRSYAMSSKKNMNLSTPSSPLVSVNFNKYNTQQANQRRQQSFRNETKRTNSQGIDRKRPGIARSNNSNSINNDDRLSNVVIDDRESEEDGEKKALSMVNMKNPKQFKMNRHPVKSNQITPRMRLERGSNNLSQQGSSAEGKPQSEKPEHLMKLRSYDFFPEND